MQKVGIGRTAEVFRDEDGNAVKLFYNWMPESEAAKEAAILQTVSKLCKRAPRFIGLCRVEGRNGLRFEFIDGKMAGSIMMTHPLRLFSVARSMGLLHRELHSLQASGLGSGEDIFSVGLRAFQEIDEDIKSTLLEFVHTQQGSCLCHGDFHPENVMIDANAQMRVIDWVNCYSGDPMSDIARTYYLIRYGRSPQKRTPLESLLERVVRPLIANAYLHAYFGKEKVPKKDLRRWMLVVMVNRLRDNIPEEEPALKKHIQRVQGKIRRSSLV